MRFYIILFLMTIILSSCTKKQDVDKIKIQWRKGQMESALKEAREKKLPLLVYWGAVWCPPCNALKARVFSDKSFIQATKGFIPVYLDGDTDSAQVWGEKLNASAYPTLMVLDSSGKEVVRVSTDGSAEQITTTLLAAGGQAEALDKWVSNMSFEAPFSIPEEKWMLIANYSWYGNEIVEKNKKEFGERLIKLGKLAPSNNQLNGLIIQLNGLNLLMDHLDSEKSAKVAENQVKSYRAIVESALDLSVKNFDILPAYVYSLKQYRDHLHSSDKVAFEKRVKLIMEKVRGHKEIDVVNILRTLSPTIQFVEKEAEYSAADKKLILDVSKQILEMDLDVKTYHAALSSISVYLHKAGHKELAKNELTKGLKKSHSPYYLMSTLAYLYEEEKDNGQALKWYRKAYESAEGGATQLQWAYGYLSALVRLSPKNSKAIFDQTKGLLTNHVDRVDTFAGRSQRVLKRTKEVFKKWSEDSKKVAQARKIFTALGLGCRDRHKAVSYYQEACKEYFKF